MKTGATPAMRQYQEQKKTVGDAILLFRMGDFYETFYEDAKTLSRVLGLTLTARDKNSQHPVPLAGVPYHAVDRYVAKLVRAGFKVAISEQVEDPRLAKGVVKRDVVRIITPGTLTDESLLDEREGNQLAAIVPAGSSFGDGLIGLASVEISSGRFFAQMVPAARLCDELARLRPAELLVPEAAIDRQDGDLERIRSTLSLTISPRPAHIFDAHLAERSLCEHFKVATLSGFGFDAFDASLRAAAAVLDYLKETQRSALGHVLKLSPRTSDETVLIDQVTLRSLEVERTLRESAGRDGSLLGAIDMTSGAGGARLLRNWLCYPLRDVSAILARQQAIADFRESPDRLASVREVLKEISDLERILGRIGVGRASPRDMLGLAGSLQLAEELAILIGPSALAAAPAPRAGDLLGDIRAAIAGHGELAQYLLSALKDTAPPVLRDGGFIADGFDAELDRLRAIGKDGAEWLASYQAREAQASGIPTLKVDYNSVFGYYIEITHQHRDKVPPEYVRKQTVRNAERYITDELKRYETEASCAADRAKQLELDLFATLVNKTATQLPPLQAAAQALAALDVLAALAELSRRRDYCRPLFVETSKSPTAAGELHVKRSKRAAVLEIVDGRHPVLDKLLAERFVPNDCALGEPDRILIITGPNMAGKSTYIRQVALLTLLAHTGSYVPAKSMRLSPVDRIFARVGASDELARGQSTFMVEMVETARILHNATVQSLVVLDEIGRGTSTYDGLAIAWAITEYLATAVGCRTLFATHYHELTDLAAQLKGVANFNVAVKEQLRTDGVGRDVVFLHKIVAGPTDRSYGIHVAAMAGLPPSILARSEAVLEHLESRLAREPRSGPQPPEQLMLFGREALPRWTERVLQILLSVDPAQLDAASPQAAAEAMGKLRALAEIVQEKA